MLKQKLTSLSRIVYQCCQQYGRHALLGVLWGLAVGLSIAGPPSVVPYQAHFLQTKIIPPEAKEITKPPIVEQQKKKPTVQEVPQLPKEPLTQEVIPSAPMEVVPKEPKEPVHKAAGPLDDFPVFERAIYPITKAPNWGAMRTEAEWERIYPELYSEDFVEIPPYNTDHLKRPLNELTQNLTEENIAIITEKLFYSTRFFGRYHIDSGEFEGRHAGIDFKLAAGTPVVAIAGGRVHATGTDEFLGNYIMIDHRLPNGEQVVSIYGHLESIGTSEGADVRPGTLIGTVGSTGASSGPHLHLQIDKRKSPGRHVVYVPDSIVSSVEASQWTLHPIEFIAQW